MTTAPELQRLREVIRAPECAARKGAAAIGGRFSHHGLGLTLRTTNSRH